MYKFLKTEAELRSGEKLVQERISLVCSVMTAVCSVHDSISESRQHTDMIEEEYMDDVHRCTVEKAGNE
jgi:hypothetical protein